MQEIAYFEKGHGFPVIFLHGFCESNMIWEDLSEALSDEFRVVCPDLPGFGKSPLPEKPFTLSEIGNVIIAWAKNLGIGKALVIGHSLGGYISLEILRNNPDFAPGIGLFNSSAFADPDEKKENRNKLIEFIKTNGVEPLLTTFVHSLFYPETAKNHQKVIDRILEEGKSIRPEAVINYAAAMRDRRDGINLLKKHPDDILLIAGEYDQNVPLEKTKEMAAMLNKDNVYIMPRSAHMSVFEQRERCYQAIRKFGKRYKDQS